MPYTYSHPRPAVTVDTVVFSPRTGNLAVLLVKRKHAPFKGHWALPGGFVEPNEALAAAAARELVEETGLSVGALEQLGALGDPGRDPRGHTISVAYYTFVVAESHLLAGDDAAEAAWHPLRSLPIAQPIGSRKRKSMASELAFDHGVMIELARARLQERLHSLARQSPLAPFQFVPPHFTLTELQRVYEAILGGPIDKRNFRSRLLATKAVVALAAHREGAHRPAQLYRWRSPPA